ncbi:MAG: hypothetical protein JXR37_34535 [Kiritimatiellae bacterium]|nr:hypothetical protein [Kiritimatiellia bacterium]
MRPCQLERAVLCAVLFAVLTGSVHAARRRSAEESTEPLVSSAAGFVRLAVAPGEARLCSLPFRPFSDSIQAVLAGQLTGAAEKARADCIRKWDAATQTYVSAYKAVGAAGSSVDGSWVSEPGGQCASGMRLNPGEGFYVENRQTVVQSVFLAGHVVTEESCRIRLVQGLNLFSYPFSSKRALADTALAASGARASVQPSRADWVVDSADRERFWLKRVKAGGGTRWYTAEGEPAREELTLGRAHWYVRVGRKPLIWTEPRPYDAIPMQAGAPQVTSVHVDGGAAAVLTIDTAGLGGASLEIYVKDIPENAALALEGGWSLAAAGIAVGGAPAVQWADAGASSRPGIASVHARLYLVARGDIDSDADGAPDAREVYVLGTDPNTPDVVAAQPQPITPVRAIEAPQAPLASAAPAPTGGKTPTPTPIAPVASPSPAPPPAVRPPESKIKGLRVDPGYCYGGPYAGLSTDGVADLIVTLAQSWGVNTLYVRAVNPVYGVYWANPVTPYVTSEGGHGRADLFPTLIALAHQRGIQVQAYIEPIRMKSVWDAQPGWRQKRADGGDHRPDLYPLSVYNEPYLAWTEGLIAEILDLGADGIDVAECDYATWGTESTYDAAANARYAAAFPQGTPGDADWVALRRQVLTEWYDRIGRAVHARGRRYHVTYTWAAGSTGSLLDERAIADNTGFSFDGLLELPAESRPDVILAELIWQEQAAAHGGGPFTAEWTACAADQFVAFVAGRARACVHVEISPFTGATTVVPMPDEIETSLRLALTHADGADIYDQHQAYTYLYDYNGSVDTWGAAAIANVFLGSD